MRSQDFLLSVTPSDSDVAPIMTTEATPGMIVQRKTKGKTISLQGRASDFLERKRTDYAFCYMYGDIYDVEPGREGLEHVLAGLRKHGPSWVKELDGAFVLIFFDSSRDALYVITDRINERRAFYSMSGDSHFVSNRLRLHPGTMNPDPVGVTWYLANKSVYGGRSLRRGVRVLERATIHRIENAGLTGSSYWKHRIQSDRDDSFETLSQELSDRLMSGVQRRLRDDRPLLIALSGGNDSTALLGLATKVLERDDVATFTYAGSLPPRKGGDADSAASLSTRIGVPHEALLRYNGDFQNWLDLNAELSDGSSPSGDIHAIQALEGLWTEDRAPQAVLGDEYFGMFDPKLRHREDVLNALFIHPFDSAPDLSDLLDPEIRDFASRTMEEERQEMVSDLPPNCTLSDALDYLYLDQRLSHYLLPHREKFIGAAFPIVNPFLERDIVEFMSRIPRPFRRGRRLYLATVRRMFPEIFSVPRASAAEWSTNWTREILRNRTTIEQWIRDRPSATDELLPPDRILRVLNRLEDTPRKSSPSLNRIIQAGLRKLKSVAGLDVRTPPSVAEVAPGTLLRRLLIVRKIFEA